MADEPHPPCLSCGRQSHPGATPTLCLQCLADAYRFFRDNVPATSHICKLCRQETRNTHPLPICDPCAEQVWFMIDYSKRLVADLERQRNINEIHAASRTAAGHDLVYYLRLAERVKIGTTRNLPQRLTSIPHDELLAVEPGDRHIEQQRHAQFRELWISGEWFRYERRLVMHIAKLRKTQAA